MWVGRRKAFVVCGLTPLGDAGELGYGFVELAYCPEEFNPTTGKYEVVTQAIGASLHAQLFPDKNALSLRGPSNYVVGRKFLFDTAPMPRAAVAAAS